MFVLRDGDGRYLKYEILSNEIWIHELGPAKSLKDLTVLIQYVVAKALKENLALCASVPYESRMHLFYLKMGMVPHRIRLNYVAYNYGEEIYFALREIKDSKAELVEGGIVHEILQKEQADSVDALLEKTFDRTEERVLPRLSDLIEKTPESEEFPDWGRLGSMTMKLSDLGRSVWSETINNEREFSPFNELDHLL